MNITVSPASGLIGNIDIPSSKSQTMRALVFASLSQGKCRINNPLITDDLYYGIECFKALGADIIIDKNKNRLDIIGNKGIIYPLKNRFYIGNSGILLRFISIILANSKKEVIITGDESLCSTRSMKEIINSIKQLGGNARAINGDSSAPVSIKGPLNKEDVVIDGEDSQPVSALIISSVIMNKKLNINVNNVGERPWIDVTLEWFDRFKLNYINNSYKHYKFPGRQIINAFEYNVPADFSSASFAILSGIVVPNSNIKIKNLDFSDSQGDKKIINILSSMGADIERKNNSLIVKYSKLKGKEIDVNNIIDALPLLAVAGCYAEGKTILKNAQVARKKECDRISVIAASLRKMGADIIEENDRLIIKKSVLIGTTLNSYNDHRIVLSLMVAGLFARGKTIIKDSGCIQKSYADFPKHLRMLGATIEYEK